MMDEDIEGEAIDKGKNHVIREICKLDNTKTPDELKKYVFSELVKMKRDLKEQPRPREQPPGREFNPTGAYSFSSFNVQDDV
jgi:hypothetical protein